MVCFGENPLHIQRVTGWRTVATYATKRLHNFVTLWISFRWKDVNGVDGGCEDCGVTITENFDFSTKMLILLHFRSCGTHFKSITPACI